MASALAVNLLSSLLAFLLGAAAQKLYGRWRAITPARLVWRLGQPLDVVIVQADGPGRDTPLPTLYEGDAAAAVIVSQFLQSVLGVPTPRIIRASTFAPFGMLTATWLSSAGLTPTAFTARSPGVSRCPIGSNSTRTGPI